MSNFRKAAPRRTHKERAQPSSRTHLGLLEKHSDYTQRARAYHSRQDQLNRLREAARLKNPDEFYHRMEREGEGMRDGRHVLGRGVAGNGSGGVGSGKGKRSVEVYKAMKEQDRNYLMMELQKEKHTVQRMKETLQGLTDAPAVQSSNRRQELEESEEEDDDGDDDDDESDSEDATSTATATRRHVIFTSPSSPTASSSASSSSPSTFDPAAYFDTLPNLLPLTHNRPTITQLSTAPLPTTILTKTALRHAEKERAATYREVMQREKRAAEVEGELERVEKQRLMMTKGRRRKKVVRDKFGDVVEKKSVFVWKQERKK